MTGMQKCVKNVPGLARNIILDSDWFVQMSSDFDWSKYTTHQICHKNDAVRDTR